MRDYRRRCVVCQQIFDYRLAIDVNRVVCPIHAVTRADPARNDRAVGGEEHAVVGVRVLVVLDEPRPENAGPGPRGL